ncbi:MAG TPA: M2 family metallopeptidase [Gammaproteobacteria bacterium]|nr:M2 family metallopeptidase [Gammaproteobacteria bacterium]
MTVKTPSSRTRLYLAVVALLGAALTACTPPSPPAQSAAGPTTADALAFLDGVEREFDAIGEESARINWVNATYINYDTDWLVAKIDARTTELAVKYAKQATDYDNVDVPADARRKLELLKLGLTLPAPSRPGAAQELSEITTRLSSTYSTGKIEFEGRPVPQAETEELMRRLRDPKKLEEVWTKWHDYAAVMKPDYVRMVEIANEGARELGFADVGALWRAGYDMPPDEFTAEVDRLWNQVKPLYDDLHCYVRGKLNEKYGNDVVPLDQPIRADLLGNMWAQSWGELYDFIAPADANTGIDLNRLLVDDGYDPVKIVKTGEGFFSSLGFDPLPETFWERSQIVRPEGREVICHASAWDLDARDDVRIKMCTVVGAEDFRTVHHELGHNYYQRAYKDLPNLFRGGANDGFHEAIGDTITLSITPEYLRQIGLLDSVPDASKDVGLLLAQALDGVAFLPFGLLVDKWRWEVFSGELTPDTYNTGWWALREQYQGVRPPNERPADAFDPGAKYHIPGNTPYMRYFLARILQYQFYKAACQQAGWEGPLHRCSFYGSKEVGARLNAMLELGQSKPWQDALQAFTGERRMDGSAILAYYAPLSAWLKEQNAGKTCGW